MDPIEIKFIVTVDPKDLAYAVCAGMEGGINYWARIKEYVRPDTMVFRFDEKQVYKHIDYAMNPGGSVNLEIIDGYDVKGKTQFNLTYKKLLTGLKVMQKEYPRHWANFIRDTGDAETGDVLIQCALFGEIVFG